MQVSSQGLKFYPLKHLGSSGMYGTVNITWANRYAWYIETHSPFYVGMPSIWCIRGGKCGLLKRVHAQNSEMSLHKFGRVIFGGNDKIISFLGNLASSMICARLV